MSIKKDYYYHKSVLLKQSIKELIINKNGIYIDATFGLGGHSKEIMKNLHDKGKLIAFDHDKESIEKNNISDKRFLLLHENFSCIEKVLKKFNIKKISGIIADLGISSFQLHNPERGFSNKINCNLDMRINRESNYSAKHVINTYSKKKLFFIFKKYGDFKNPSKIVEKILVTRKNKKINTTYDLKNLFFIKGSFKKKQRFFSRIFQSIRIEVNKEIDMIQLLLLHSSHFIHSKGRIVIISYHSIEDRIVKNFLKNGIIFNKKIFKKPPFNMINKKVIKPSFEEIIVNSNSRSAKLRIGEKI